MKTSVKNNIENKIFAVARIDAVKFQYEISIRTKDENHAKVILNDYRSAGEKSLMMREYPSLGLTIDEQLESQNNTLKDIKSRCDAMNKCRKAAKKAQNLVTEWYIANKADIKFKESGGLFAVWDKSLKDVLKLVYKNTGLEVRYEWDYSLCIKIKGQAFLTNGSCQYFSEFVYICDQDGELSNRETQSDFKQILPMRYLKGLDELKALKEKRDLIDSKTLKLNNFLGL